MGTNKSVSDKKRQRSNLKSGADDATPRDARFAAAEWDPRFGRVPKKAKKGIADERFQEQLKNNPGFRPSHTPVDRFGRPKKQGPSLDRHLKEHAEGSSDSDSSSEDEITAEAKAMPKADDVGEDDSSDDDSSIEGLDDQEDEEVEDIPRGRATRRLAVMGLDWSTTRAVDIYASLDSFVPAGKSLVSVSVHPSKFGLERLAVEAKLGPQVVSKVDLDVVENAKKQASVISDQATGSGSGEHDDLASDDDESDAEDSVEDSDDDMAEELRWKEQVSLRKYEEERLKYYYAVVDFEDVKAADAVYEQCDGVEYAQSGRAFDLRFIPDDMSIETEPRDTAKGLPEGYAPPNVTPSTLNNSHVKLSWDADDPDRVILKKKAVGKHALDEENLKAYLASSSEDDEQKPSAEDIEKKRRLLLGPAEDEPVLENEEMDMEVTFEPGMLEKGEEIVKRKVAREERKEETAWEARLRRQEERKAEKRRLRKEAFAAKNADDDDGEGDVAAGRAEDGIVDNPTFESDPFFSMAGDDGDASAKTKSAAKKKKKDRKKERAADTNDGGEEDKEQKRKAAELELLMMKDKPDTKSGETSMREMLAAVESDDDDDREKRRKEKKTRGKRRSQKTRAENGTSAKPSAVDTSDARFQGLFESHLYAMDPTHPKFKDNETTQKILKEKSRRSKKISGDMAPPDANAKGKLPAGEGGTKVASGAKNGSDVMELAARLKARASSKRKKGKGK